MLHLDRPGPARTPKGRDDSDGTAQQAQNARTRIKRPRYGKGMAEMASDQAEHRPERPEEQAGYSPEAIKWPAVISYNLREEERPGGPDGLKVRWKWRVETGKKAQALDARQAEAIRKALQWLHTHQQQT